MLIMTSATGSVIEAEKTFQVELHAFNSALMSSEGHFIEHLTSCAKVWLLVTMIVTKLLPFLHNNYVGSSG
jgi:hypothetical protein